MDSEPDDEEEKSALQAAKALISSIENGTRPERLHARYYIMPLSGANGRMMVRLWQEEAMKTFTITSSSGSKICPSFPGTDKGGPSLSQAEGLGNPASKARGDPKKVWSRMDDELLICSNGS